ncbi:MAG: hypothetical protein E6423_12550 [Clostridium sp.]|nr:hypothetical protein [Clostridium sp.]
MKKIWHKYTEEEVEVVNSLYDALRESVKNEFEIESEFNSFKKDIQKIAGKIVGSCN